MIGSQFSTDQALIQSNIAIPNIEDVIVAKATVAGVNSRLALKIAVCESGLRQFNEQGGVLRGGHNPDDAGLFPINQRYHLTQSQTQDYDIYSTEGNIDYALGLLKEEGTRHWRASQACWGTK